MSALAGLSVVLLCLNEEADIERAVRSTAEAAARASEDCEVIVVDDGSTDATLAIASELARRDRRVRVLVHPGVRGYGAAARTAIGAARMPWILLTDVRLPVDPNELQRFLPVAPDADLIVGWRTARSDPFTRRIGTAARNLLARHVLGVPVHDADCVFKLARRDLVASLPLRSDGTMIATELVVRTLAAGGRVREVEVRSRPPSAKTPRLTSPRGHAGRRLRAG